MKYGLLFGYAAIALMTAPVSASAGSGVPGGMAYGFHRGSEIAGPVFGGIPGAVVGGVTGGVEGVLGIEHHPQYVAAREEYRQSGRRRTSCTATIITATTETEVCEARPDAPGGPYLVPG